MFAPFSVPACHFKGINLISKLAKAYSSHLFKEGLVVIGFGPSGLLTKSIVKIYKIKIFVESDLLSVFTHLPYYPAFKPPRIYARI